MKDDYTTVTPLCPNMYKIVDMAGAYNPRPKINGKQKYARLLIVPQFKPEDINTEVIDTKTKTIYRCREQDIPYIIKLIEDKDMKERLQKNHKRTDEEIENMRFIYLCLMEQGDITNAEIIESQYLDTYVLEPQPYNILIGLYYPMIAEDTIKTVSRRIKKIYNMRGEKLPTIIYEANN